MWIIALSVLLLPLARAHPYVSKRAYPVFIDTDSFGDGQEAQIKAALPDAIDLATRVQQNYDSYKDIWSKYFPESDHATVQKVFQNIVSDPSSPGQGSDAVALCRISGFDMSTVNPTVEECGEASAYTFNWPSDSVTDEMPVGSSYTYFCPEAYKETSRYSDITCSQLTDTLNDGMDFLGATIMHEWLHNDGIGKAATGTHITDVNGENGYGPYNTRQMLINSPNDCINNADSYTWLAIEVFWTTSQCFTGGSATRFKDPVAPNCSNSKRKRDAGECSGQTTAFPATITVPPTFSITVEAASSTITSEPLTCYDVGPSPGTGVDEGYCDCKQGSSSITLSYISSAIAESAKCAYSTFPGSSAQATVTTDVTSWTTNCAACTLTGGVGGGEETCTTVSGCTPTAIASPTIVAWVANVGTIDIGNADDGDPKNLASDMFTKLSGMCDSSGCKGDHQEMDNVEAVISGGEEPLKPAMYIDGAQYTSVDMLDKMLAVGLGSWVSAMNNSGLNLCTEVEYEADADETGSGCGSGPIPTRRVRRKTRQSDGATLWERDGLVEEELALQKRCSEKRGLDERECGSNPMVCHYNARMCNAPDSITVVAGDKSDPYANHLNIGVTLDTSGDGFDCELIVGGLLAFTEIVAPELLEEEALAGIELESICGVTDDTDSAFDKRIDGGLRAPRRQIMPGPKTAKAIPTL